MGFHTAAAAQYLFERGWYSAYKSTTHEEHHRFSAFCDALNTLFQRPLSQETIAPYIPGLDAYHRAKGRRYPEGRLYSIAVEELREAEIRAQRS